MSDTIKKLLRLALVVCLAGGLQFTAGPAQAQDTSVLSRVHGLTSSDITVLIDRAIIVQSDQPFIEVSVAQPAVADVSPLSDRTLYIFGKARGKTTLTLLGENGTLITSVTISVMPDLGELKQRLKEMLPREPIEVRLSGPNIVLSGVVSGKKKIDRAMSLASAYGNVVNMMSVGGTQQVMLKVRVAEMTRSAAKELGLNAWVAGEGHINGNDYITGTGSTGAGVTPVVNGDGFFPLGDPTAISPTWSGFGNIGVLAVLGDIGIGFALQALEEKGFSRTLAEPNLVAMSGNEAKFLAGQEVPIPQVGKDNEVKITFKQVGIGLNFRPVVLDDDLISLSVSTEVSSIDTTTPGVPISAAQGNVAPVFRVRRATTVVELRDGQSFAIAGLLQDDFSDSISQFPWLGDLPVLGALFRSTDYARGETELVIIISAHLVVPVDESELSIPLDRVRIPNEFELFLLGHTDASGAPGLVESQGFDGDFGYVVE